MELIVASPQVPLLQCSVARAAALPWLWQEEHLGPADSAPWVTVPRQSKANIAVHHILHVDRMLQTTIMAGCRS